MVRWPRHGASRELAAEWRTSGKHQAASDSRFDQALVRTSSELPLRALIAVVDALHEPRRDVTIDGRVQRLPAFAVMLSSSDPTGPIPGARDLPEPRLAPEIIQRIVRGNYELLRNCYEGGLQVDPTLEGKVTVRFVIGEDGTITSLQETGERTLHDDEAVQCMLGVYRAMKFPPPLGGTVTVVYPINFERPK